MPNPKIGFYFSKENVAMARKNIETYAWAAERFQEWKRTCDEFLRSYTEQDIYDCVLSMVGQTFAYGISGCPHCQKAFPSSPEAQSRLFSRFPVKTLTCPTCSCTLPNDELIDKGQGFVHNGTAYYPIGMWNFYTAGWLLGGVRDHEGIVTKLTYMYMITNEEKYGQRAITILDAFSAIFPGTIGPRDFTPFGSQTEMGRLHLLTSIVFRVKVFLAQNYDWLYRLKELDVPSPALALLEKPGTIRENIERMLYDYLLTEPGGPSYNLKDGNLTELHNHEADGIRAMLAVGLVTDNRDYCNWGIRATEVFLANAVGRDGMYFEGSYGYSMFTITVFLDMALLSIRAASPAELASFHPFASERFFRFAVENPIDILCQGHLPCYGDWGQDLRQSCEPDIKTMTDVYRAALHFYHFSPDPKRKQEAASYLQRIYPIAEKNLGEKGIDLFLLHPRQPQTTSFQLPVHTTFLGQSGIGVLRDANQTTLLMRTGANSTHAHDDVLACQYYAYGKEISADIGYSMYGSNGHYGWSTKSVAHNTVVVNKDKQMKKGKLYKPFSGGEFSFFYTSPYIAAFEGKAPDLYKIDAFQRAIALVPLPDGSSYWADFFYIQGADTCDYAFHAFHEKACLQVEGAKEKRKEGVWTMAGLESSEKLYFDEPGKSFGERLTIGETFSPLLNGEKAQYWTFEPNNGYGFIYDTKQYEPRLSSVKARWESEQGFELTWYGITDKEDQILTGMYPTLSGQEHHPILLVRSPRTTKQYTAIIHTTRKMNTLRITAMHGLAARGIQVTAFVTEISNGWLDFWAYSPVTQTMCVHTRFGEWRMEGRCGWIRTDRTGNILVHACIQASKMTFQGKTMTGSQQAWLRIQDIDYKKRAIRLEPHSPPENTPYIRIAPASDSPSSLYSVQSIEAKKEGVIVTMRDSFFLSKGIVTFCDKNMIHTKDPLPLAASFPGKLILGTKGGKGVIEKVSELKQIRARVLTPFTIGEEFHVVDIAQDYWAQWL
jgi:hypothetical protein